MKLKLHEEVSHSVPINVVCSQRWLVFAAMILILSFGLIVVATDEASAQEKLDRTVLPVQEPLPPTSSELDARNATPPQRFEVNAPSGAPNIVIVLIDDIGFGGPSTLGGPLNTPTMDRLAENGLLYNNFHTTALCSPTRMALKTGRNHHTCNTGSIMETATAFPGNTGALPNRVAPLAEMLRLNGYSTGAFGKWHETAAWEASVSGPLDRWTTSLTGLIGLEGTWAESLLTDGLLGGVGAVLLPQAVQAHQVPGVAVAQPRAADQEALRERLARVLLDQGRGEEALTTLQGASDISGFEARYAEVRGDILFALGRTDESVSAYRQALDSLEAGVGDRGKLVLEVHSEALVRRLNQPKAPAKPEAADEDPDVRRLLSDLTERLGAKVALQQGSGGKGRLVISYNNLEELEGILDHIR